MNLDRLRELSGLTEADHSKYKEPKADHAKKPGGDVVSKDNDMEYKRLDKDAATKKGDQSGDYEKEPGGDVVSKDNDMKWTKMKTTKQSKYSEPKANHAQKTGGDTVKAKWTTMKEDVAQAIVDSGDVEGAIRDLLEQLKAHGIDI